LKIGQTEARAFDRLKRRQQVGWSAAVGYSRKDGPLSIASLVERTREELLVVGIPVQDSLEPAALGRDVVEHAVVHQPEAQAELFEILPGTQSRVDLLEVDDGKAASEE
jgi:hypothetical protein